mgnify:CR=1 FL=1|tara:strand:+ start:725 stop:1030 length:306 start_codon:yes stop_codon:yes gene_type:complete
MSKNKYKVISHKGIGFATINDQKYLFPGWIPVEDNISFDDVDVTDPYANIKKDTYKVTGSKGDKYTVTNRNGTFTCDCPAGKFRGSCKHSKQIKKELSLAE